MEKVIDNQGVKLHLVKTDKYKTNTIVFKMKAPMKKNMQRQGHFFPMYYKAAPIHTRHLQNLEHIWKIFTVPPCLSICKKRENTILFP